MQGWPPQSMAHKAATRMSRSEWRKIRRLTRSWRPHIRHGFASIIPSPSIPIRDALGAARLLALTGMPRCDRLYRANRRNQNSIDFCIF